MSHSIFDGLSVVSLEGTGLTVQQLLDSTLIQNTVTIDDHNVTSTNPSIDHLNSNYTSISVIDEALSFDDDDLFQCGRCKFQFSSLEPFMVHKRSQCSSLKVKKEVSSERVIPSSSSSGDCDSEQSTLSQVSSSISHKEVAQVESSQNQNEKYNCLASAVPDTQSVVINDGEFFNLTLDGAQVFTLQENLGLSGTESEKIIEGKNGDSLFRASAALIREGDSQLTPTTLPCIVTEEVAEGAADTIGPHIKEENGMESTLVVPVITPESKACDYNRILFHGRMAKGTNNKEIVRRKHLCMFCNKAFTKNFDLQQHIRSHTGEKPFQCIVCGRAFAQKSNVKKHMSTHKVWPKDSVCNTLPKEPIKKVLSLSSGNESGDDISEVKEEFLVDNSYVCPFCSLVHTSYLELRSHMKQHKDQKVYRCIQKECDETFSELDSFLDHTRAAHDKEVQYRCHTCSKLFGSLHSLGFHQFEHSIYPWPKKSGPSYFRCTKCMNKYASAEALDHHLKMSKHHFPCKQCSRIFSSERLLRTHLRVHGNVNLFTCATCCKDLKSEHSLKVHQLIHTGERPFECQICNSSFNRKDKLKRHMLVHEPKKFKCLFSTSLGCQREFSRKDKLRLHLMSHTHANSRKRSTKSGDKREAVTVKNSIEEENCAGEQNQRMEVGDHNNGNGNNLDETVSIKQEDDHDSRISPKTSLANSSKRTLRPGRRIKITKGNSATTETKIRVKEHGLCMNGLMNEGKSDERKSGLPGVSLAKTDLSHAEEVEIAATKGTPHNGSVMEASYAPLAINDDTSSSRSEFIMTYSDDEDTLRENVEIIYIPFALGQNDFIETGNKKDEHEEDLITTSVDVESSPTAEDSDESFFVSTEEIDNLEDISAEILLTEPNLSVIEPDVNDTVGISDDTIVVNDTVGMNDSNSFFVVKGVDPGNEGVALSFDDTRTIILENKEGENEDFCV